MAAPDSQYAAPLQDDRQPAETLPYADREASTLKKFLRMTIRIALYVLLGYIVLVLLFVLLEPWLVYPAPPVAIGTWDPSEYEAEEVVFESGDSTRLHGWYFEHPNPQAQVLFCHGNGEHLGLLGPWADQLRSEHRVSLFVFDYRGYGKSHGRPHEEGVLQDAEAALQWLADRADVRPDQVVIYGRSLGGAVAVHLAAEKGARGLIIERAFDSMVDLAADLYPWLPVRLAMRNRYHSVGKIRSYDGPLLQLHGAEDALVPVEFAKRLFEAAPSKKKRFVAMPGIGHNDPTPAEFEREMADFIESLPEVEEER